MLLVQIVLFRADHTLDNPLGPDALKIVDPELRVRGHEPPHDVGAEVGHRILAQVALTPVLLFELVDIALVLVDALELLCEDLVCEEGEEDAFDERNNTHDEGNGVARAVHVHFGAFAGEQVVEREEHQEGEIDAREADVDDELDEVLVVTLAHAVVNPGAVVVHLENAEATFLTVMGPDWFPCRLALALHAVPDLHELALEWCFHAFGHTTRISKCPS